MKRSRAKYKPHRKGDEHLTSPKALRDQARRLIVRAEALQHQMQKRIEDLRREATARIEAAEKIEAAMELPRSTKVRTLQRVEARTEEAETWRTGAPLTSEHPFPAALAREKITVPEWAKAHRVSEEKVRSWYRAHQTRRIPRKFARDIQKEFGLPADDTIWPKGIKG